MGTAIDTQLTCYYSDAINYLDIWDVIPINYTLESFVTVLTFAIRILIKGIEK